MKYHFRFCGDGVRLTSFLCQFSFNSPIPRTVELTITTSIGGLYLDDPDSEAVRLGFLMNASHDTTTALLIGNRPLPPVPLLFH